MGAFFRSGRILRVSASLARHYWNEQEALGKRIGPEEPTEEEGDRWVTIAGVVEDIHIRALETQPEEVGPRPPADADGGWTQGPPLHVFAAGQDLGGLRPEASLDISSDSVSQLVPRRGPKGTLKVAL